MTWTWVNEKWGCMDLILPGDWMAKSPELDVAKCVLLHTIYYAPFFLFFVDFWYFVYHKCMIPQKTLRMLHICATAFPDFSVNFSIFVSGFFSNFLEFWLWVSHSLLRGVCPAPLVPPGIFSAFFMIFSWI